MKIGENMFSRNPDDIGDPQMKFSLSFYIYLNLHLICNKQFLM